MMWDNPRNQGNINYNILKTETSLYNKLTSLLTIALFNMYLICIYHVHVSSIINSWFLLISFHNKRKRRKKWFFDDTVTQEKPPWDEWTRPIIHSDLTLVALGVPRVRSEHNCETVEFNWGWWGGRSYWPGIQCRDDVSCSRDNETTSWTECFGKIDETIYLHRSR